VNILISGARGFIGRNLVEYLTGKGYCILAPNRTQLDFTNTSAVEQYFRTNNIDVIIHCAMVSHTSAVNNSDKFAGDVVERNLRMFFNIQRCMTDSMKLIHLGSGAEYSRPHWHNKMPEDYFDQYVPEDSYGYAKYLISKYIESCKNVICLRIFGVFGKYENYLNRFVSNSIVKNLLKMPITINKNVVYDYLYINDLLSIIEYFINGQAKYKYYNVTPSKPIDLITIANMVNQTSDYKSDIHVLNEGIGTEYSGDNNRLLSEIANYRFIPYKQAIADLYQYYVKNMNDINCEAVRADGYLKYVKYCQQKDN